MFADDSIFENNKVALSESQTESVFYFNFDEVRPLPEKPRTRYDSELTPTAVDDFVEIELASQFYAWLGSLNEIENEQESKIEVELLTRFTRQESYCSSIVDKTTDLLSTLQQLKEKYISVSEKTNDLHETCECLLRKQTELTDTANKTEEFLQYFTVLTSIEAKLGSRNIILSADRMESVIKSINASIVFLKQHLTFKDSESYLIRFNACLSASLMLVKESIKNFIRQIIIEIVELGDAVTTENSFILLYGRFRSQASRICSWMELLESRVEISNDYRDAIIECQIYYLTKREVLVIPVAQASIADLINKYSCDHCELFRTAISFMLHMCEDEVLLFKRFFVSSEVLVSAREEKTSHSLRFMLANLCRCAYDALRPFLIHINHIEILTELCDLLKNEFLDEQIKEKSSDALSAFKDMCLTLLADVQQRLIYRAHVYIKSQIQDYEPSSGDLVYPEKLEMIEQITANVQRCRPTDTQAMCSEFDDNQQKKNRPELSSSSADFHGMWYPTVRRALVCISSLSRCLDLESFQGLAQNCLSSCIRSLVIAQKRIEERKSTSDGQLFLIKHLLILRDQLTPFNVEFRTKETSLDFSDIKSAAYQALPILGSKLFDLNRANTLLRLLLFEGPTVVDRDVDSRRQLDQLLKATCEDFINQTVFVLTRDISALMEKTKTSESTKAIQVLGRTDQLKDVVSISLRLLSSGQATAAPNSLALIRQKLSLYLGNQNTVAVIMRHVETGVVKAWRQLASFVAEIYTPEERMVIACPTDSQIRLFFHA